MQSHLCSGSQGLVCSPAVIGNSPISIYPSRIQSGWNFMCFCFDYQISLISCPCPFFYVLSEQCISQFRTVFGLRHSISFFASLSDNHRFGPPLSRTLGCAVYSGTGTIFGCPPPSWLKWACRPWSARHSPAQRTSPSEEMRS